MKTREWFTERLVKLKALAFSVAFSAGDAKELEARTLEIGAAVMEATGLSRSESADLICDHLLRSEKDRQEFYVRYNVPSAFACRCLQMRTSA